MCFKFCGIYCHIRTYNPHVSVKIHRDSDLCSHPLPSPPLLSFRPDPVSADQLLSQTEAPEPAQLVSRPPETQRRCGIVLRRNDYFTVPSLDELDQQSKPGQDLVVQDFTVGRKTFGKVRFLGPTCVSGLNLDELGKWKRGVHV